MTMPVSTVYLMDRPEPEEFRGYTKAVANEGVAVWVWPDSQIVIPLHRVKMIVETQE